jgi:hypothetical protein
MNFDQVKMAVIINCVIAVMLLLGTKAQRGDQLHGAEPNLGGPRLAKTMMPDRLPDGVRVEGGTELRTLRATWVVLVTLQAPKYPDGLKELISRIRMSQTSV